MREVERALGPAVYNISDQNYAESISFCRLWIDIEQTYRESYGDPIFDTVIWNKRVGSSFRPIGRDMINSTAHLFLRLASDVESDHALAPFGTGLQSRLCARSLREFFSNNLETARTGSSASNGFFADANLIAHWANLGHVGKNAIRNHILQSLVSHSKLHGHQADALIILFTLAGATFETYVDPSVVDRCFKLLDNHFSRDSLGGRMVQVRVSHLVAGGYRAKTNFRR